MWTLDEEEREQLRSEQSYQWYQLLERQQKERSLIDRNQELARIKQRGNMMFCCYEKLSDEWTVYAESVFLQVQRMRKKTYVMFHLENRRSTNFAQLFDAMLSGTIHGNQRPSAETAAPNEEATRAIDSN